MSGGSRQSGILLLVLNYRCSCQYHVRRILTVRDPPASPELYQYSFQYYMYVWRGYLSVCIICFACILPSLHLVAVVLGTAIPASLYIFGKCFSYLYMYILESHYNSHAYMNTPSQISHCDSWEELHTAKLCIGGG